MNGQQVRDDLGSTRPEAPIAFALPEIAFPDVETAEPAPAPGDPQALITAILAGLETQRPLTAAVFPQDDTVGPGLNAVAAEAEAGLHSDDLRDNVPAVTVGVAVF